MVDMGNVDARHIKVGVRRNDNPHAYMEDPRPPAI